MKEYIVKCENNHSIKRMIGDDSKIRYKIVKSGNCNFCKLFFLNKHIEENDGYLISCNFNKLCRYEIIKIKCKNDHIWETDFFNLKRNTWCPDCSKLKYEKICRIYFEQIFGVKFLKTKPDFLIQENGFCLELDGFNEKLKIAFEHQGSCHYEIIKKFNMDESSLQKVQLKDKIKLEKCNDFGVRLFIIPELVSRLKIENLKNFILNESIVLGVSHLANFNIKIDLSSLHNNNDINEYKEIAKKRGGECLSDVYIDINSDLQFKCVKGHIWKARPLNVKHNNTWCMKCSGKEKYTIEFMHELAKSKNGKCLSNEYFGMSTKLEWECKDGHRWWAAPNDIKNTTVKIWCKKCRSETKGINNVCDVSCANPI